LVFREEMAMNMDELLDMVEDMVEAVDELESVADTEIRLLRRRLEDLLHDLDSVGTEGIAAGD
tara:strand:+ start:1513 stop:1701 length:189 start_codon:yes stop_codon:yes gene_type:complete